MERSTKLVLENMGYQFTFCGVTQVKGKGEMLTYFLKDLKEDSQTEE